MHQSLRRTALAALLTSTFPFAFAADEAAVVVTATRAPTRLNTLLSDATVVTREEIEKAPQSTLAELLQVQPGLEIAANGGPGQTNSLFIRGANSGHAVILIDGMRLGSATLGSVALETIPTSQIERIEIVRGPMSSLYGADAIGGVIQIFTRRGLGEPRANFNFGAGRWNTTRAGGGYGGEAGPWRFSVQAGEERSGGFSAISHADPTLGIYDPFNSDRDGTRNRNLSGNLSYRIGADHEFGINSFSSSSRTQFDASNCDAFFSTCTSAFNNRNEQRQSSTGLYARNRLTPVWQSTLRYGETVDDYRSNSLDPTTGVESWASARTKQNQIQWQNDLRLPIGRLMLGAEQLDQHVTSSTIYPVNLRTIRSLLAGWQQSFGSHEFQANLRRDSNSQFGRRDTGSAAYGYHLNDAWRISGSVGTAFKAPSIADLYYPFDGMAVGNPNLRPERAHSRELALRYDGVEQSASATLYRNRVSDLISWSFNPTTFVFSPANVGTAVLQGATLAWQARMADWRLKANLDVQSPRDTDTDRLLPFRAQRHAGLAAERSFGRWNAGAEVVGSSVRYDSSTTPRRLGGYGLLNLNANYAIDRDWSVFARANNIFDKRYELIRSYATPGANLFVGVRYEPR